MESKGALKSKAFLSELIRLVPLTAPLLIAAGISPELLSGGIQLVLSIAGSVLGIWGTLTRSTKIRGVL